MAARSCSTAPAPAFSVIRDHSRKRGSRAISRRTLPVRAIAGASASFGCGWSMQRGSIPQQSCRLITAWMGWHGSARTGATSRSSPRNKSRISWPTLQRCATRKPNDMPGKDRSTRRHFLKAAGSAALAGTVSRVTLRPAEATPAMLNSAIRNVVGEAPLRAGKVKLDIPPLVENGNTVPMTVSVTSPMTAEDHVKRIHVFNEKNPQPNIGNFYLGPHAGRAQISTRIRLADSQKIVAIARLSDDSFWSVSVDVVVTLAACTDEVI